MTQHTCDDGSSGVLDVATIRNLARFEYRSMVIRQLQVTVEWQHIEWLDLAACSESRAATRETCGGCSVRAPCLTAALAWDDPAPWRGGLCRDEREELWEHLNSTFTTLRDRSFMHLDRLVDGRGSG
jgi:Transcription factor WhiB